MKHRVTIKKHAGDDIYSWAVFLDGRPVLTGLSRREATYERDQQRRRLGCD